MHLSAERVGFEPTIPFWGIHTFQACSFDHSDISPLLGKGHKNTKNIEKSDETYKQAEKLLGKNYITQIIMAIVTINAWNRIAVSTKKENRIEHRLTVIALIICTMFCAVA